MRKKLFLLIIFSLILTFVGCGSDTKSDTDAPSANNETAVAAHSFSYNNIKIEMGTVANDVLSKLGEPKSVTEETSCAFEGMDKTYYFGSFYVTTYPNGDKENFYSAWFVDDSLTTEEGIYIGASKAAVDTAYGADSFNGTNAYIINKGASKLTVILTDDVVSAITYDAIID